MTYWQNTKSPARMMFKKKIYEGAELADHLADNVGIDAAILAAGIGLPHVNRLAVKAYQRKLGIRKISSWRDYK
jgi:hypothetical protein